MGQSTLGPAHTGQRQRGFRPRRIAVRGNAHAPFLFSKEADCLHVLSVNVLTSGWLKLLNHAHLSGMIWHFAFI